MPGASEEGGTPSGAPIEQTAAVAAESGTAGTLPFTGSESLIVVLMGLMALGLGAGLRKVVGPRA